MGSEGPASLLGFAPGDLPHDGVESGGEGEFHIHLSSLANPIPINPPNAPDTIN